MIRGVHTMFYASDADAFRTFLRDVVGFTDVVDVGEGWLIFNLPEADMGVHPTASPDGSQVFGTPGQGDISFYCDDIHGTVAELRAKGAVIDAEIADHGYGWVTHIDAPGGVRVQLYEPKYDK